MCVTGNRGLIWVKIFRTTAAATRFVREQHALGRYRVRARNRRGRHIMDKAPMAGNQYPVPGAAACGAIHK